MNSHFVHLTPCSIKRYNEMQHIVFCTSIYPFCYHLAMLHSVKSSLLAYALLPSAILFLLFPLLSLRTFDLFIFMLFSFYSAPLCISLSIRQPGNHPAQKTHYAPQAAQLHHRYRKKTSSSELQAAAPSTHPKLMMALGKWSFFRRCREATHQCRKTRAEQAWVDKAIGGTGIRRCWA